MSVVKRERELTRLQTHWQRGRVDESAQGLVRSNESKTHDD